MCSLGQKYILSNTVKFLKLNIVTSPPAPTTFLAASVKVGREWMIIANLWANVGYKKIIREPVRELSELHPEPVKYPYFNNFKDQYLANLWPLRFSTTHGSYLTTMLLVRYLALK